MSVPLVWPGRADLRRSVEWQARLGHEDEAIIFKAIKVPERSVYCPKVCLKKHCAHPGYQWLMEALCMLLQGEALEAYGHSVQDLTFCPQWWKAGVGGCQCPRCSPGSGVWGDPSQWLAIGKAEILQGCFGLLEDANCCGGLQAACMMCVYAEFIKLKVGTKARSVVLWTFDSENAQSVGQPCAGAPVCLAI